MIRRIAVAASLALALISPALPASPQATPAPTLTSFTAQLLDVRRDFVTFTTGDAFRVAPDLQIVDDATGAPYHGTPAVKMFARASLDAQGRVTRLAVTTKRLPPDASYATVQKFAVARSTTAPAPELAGLGLTGRPVAVQFIVRVPPTTPVTDTIYLATDASGWSATAIKMDRVDGEHYRATRTFASGTKFAYRYTRGSWNQVERGEDGLEPPVHNVLVREADAFVRRDTVYHWSDERNGQEAASPDSIPTPFNPDPFGGMSIPGRTRTPPPLPPGQRPK